MDTSLEVCNNYFVNIIYMYMHILFCVLMAVYKQCGYVGIVKRAAEQSMQAAVEEVKSLPIYDSSGEVIVHMHNYLVFSGVFCF